MAEPNVLGEREAYSEKRVQEFRDLVAEAVPELSKCPGLCIYTTGSFGRHEAGSHSDLDLFFVRNGEGKVLVAALLEPVGVDESRRVVVRGRADRRQEPGLVGGRAHVPSSFTALASAFRSITT